MGDHRGDSDDSRYHTGDPGGGAVPESEVVGRAFLIIWPPSQIRDLPIPSTFGQAALHAGAAGAAMVGSRGGRRGRADAPWRAVPVAGRRRRAPAGSASSARGACAGRRVRIGRALSSTEVTRQGQTRGWRRQVADRSDEATASGTTQGPGTAGRERSRIRGQRPDRGRRRGRRRRGRRTRGRTRSLARAAEATAEPSGAGFGVGRRSRRGAPGAAGRKRKQRSFWRELPILIAIALLLAVIIKTYAIQAFWIPSGSMENTLEINDRVLVNKIVYHTPRHSPRRHRGLQRRRLLGSGHRCRRPGTSSSSSPTALPACSASGTRETSSSSGSSGYPATTWPAATRRAGSPSTAFR